MFELESRAKVLVPEEGENPHHCDHDQSPCEQLVRESAGVHDQILLTGFGHDVPVHLSQLLVH